MRILIADQQPLFSRGLRSALEATGDCTVVGETQDWGVLLTLVSQSPTDVDVALIDARILNSNMADVQQLRTLAPRLALIVLSAAAKEEEFFQVLRVGAAAYLVRSVEVETVREVVRRVSQGEYVFSDDILLTSPKALPPARAAHPNGRATSAGPIPTGPGSEEESCVLSAREQEILRLIAGGNSNKAIARSLGISDQTVKNHITAILRKLLAHDRTEAVMLGVQHGWVRLEPVLTPPSSTARKRPAVAKSSMK